MKKINKTQVIVISVSTIILLLIVFYYNIDSEQNQKKTTFIIGQIKDTFQILFFIIVGILTFLSYLQAKKTLFTPIKTETFKIQIKAFEDILAFFQNKDESDFKEQFDYDFMVFSNAHFLLKDYVELFFKDKITIKDEYINSLKENIAGMVIDKDYMETVNFSTPNYYEKIETPKKEEITSPAIILNKWKSYKYGMVHFSKKYADETEKIKQLIASPLIPDNIKNKIIEFEELVSINFHIIGPVLTKIAQEFPEKFPNETSIQNFQPSGIWNQYNRKSEHLAPKAKEILTEIRTYLKIDDLVK
ncbi:MAG: hypothetical protein DI622_06505 [Chryseobacterium sp.]|nr:MAG: hypothetical protein DI622_06505 [Chryseobacterium sp.]